MPLDLIKGLYTIYTRHTSTVREYRHSSLILAMNGTTPFLIAKIYGCCPKTAKRWYLRIRNLLKSLEKAETPLSAMTADAIEQMLRLMLKDKPRVGAPLTYTPEQQCAIIGLAIRSPEEFGLPINYWTHRELALIANREGMAKGVSASTVGRILSTADLKPHMSKYWEKPNIEDEEEFQKQVAFICETYKQAAKNLKAGIHTVCIDEKTGIQALERLHPTKPSIPGRLAKVEFEYIRHSTQTIIPCFEVASGQIIAARIGQTRTELDFAAIVKQAIETEPEAEWIFVSDQLNTHKSESIVKLIAEKIGFECDLGIKEKKGILKSMSSREKFITDLSHRIRFVFTPKHCSWLNQIEIWFSILSRKVLKRGSFSSTDELRQKMFDFIDYFNKTMAKAFKWTYKGRPLQA